MLGDIRVGDCLLRSQLHTIENGERCERLEPKAMQVLALLVERRGDVVAREEILSRVWNGRFVSDEVLTNAISQIRRALGDDPRNPRYIQTIAKNGYRMIAPIRPTRKRWVLRWLAAGILAASLISVMSLRRSEHEVSDGVPPGVSGMVLVNEFESLSKDDDLEWLRTGIAELMVTGISRTSRLHVLGPSQSRAFEVDDPRGADLVIGGSFARIGARLRIDAHAKDSVTGKIVAAESVESTSDSELFDIVDDLATRMAVRLELVHDGEPHLSRALRDITTGSLDAYRHYVEAMRRYYYNLDHHGALELYQKAVELDPGFAMAFAKMTILYMNLGDYANANASARRALEHLERLPPAERYYATGNFYVTREEGYARALEAYEKTLELDHLHLAARHNKAFILFRWERYREAIDELERLVAAGVRFPGSYRLLMTSYAALGEFEEGQRIAHAYVALHPEKWIGYRNLGQHLMRFGRLAEAHEALQRADALRPKTTESCDWWQLRFLQGHSPAPPSASNSAVDLGRAMERLYAGKSAPALAALEEILSGSESGREWAPVVLILSAEVLLQIGDYQRSLDAAERARELGRGNTAEWHALSLAARAEARRGNWNDAATLVRELERRTESLRTHKERRRLHHLRGELALTRGDFPEALAELDRAERLLSPRGFPITIQIPQHVPIRYARAEAYRAAGRRREAIRWYQSVADSTTERLVWPIPFVRSYYRLGLLYEAEGDVERAISSYRRFLDFWEHGELDRVEIQIARSKVDAHERTSASALPAAESADDPT